MKLNRFFGFLSFALLYLAAINGHTQGVRSPYTVLGVGEQPLNATINNQGMGMLGVANPALNYVNFGNPALLTYNSIFGFDLAGYYESRTLAKDEATETHTTGNFHHMVMALPIKRNKWTMAFGVNPFSTINHQIRGENQIEGTNTLFINDLSFRGGLNEVFLSQGVRIGKYVNLGAKASYIFGNRNETNETFLISDEVALADITTRYLQRQSYSDLMWSGGFAVVVPTGNRKQLNIGGTYRHQSRIQGKDFTKLEQFRSTDLITITADTILNDVPGSLLLPSQWVFGLSYGQLDKYRVLMEYRTSNWGQFENTLQAQSNLARSNAITIGAQYTPDYTSINNYLNLMTFRVGFSLENTPFTVNGEQIDEAAIHFGLTAPLRYNSLNVGFKFGNRGSLSNNLIRENFFRISLGISVGDESWFYRQRFN